MLFRSDLIINLSDTFNGLMAIPNLIGVLALAGTVKAITNNYCKRKFRNKKDIKPMLSFFESIQEENENELKAAELNDK